MGVFNVISSYDEKKANLGRFANRPATSALEIIDVAKNRTDGVYFIELPTVGVTPVYCLLSTMYDGGGWMLAMKATRGTTFSYTANYWTTDNTLNPNNVSLIDADAKYEVMNKFAAKDLLAKWPDLGISGTTSGSISSASEWNWLENNFNGGTRQTLISFFNAPSGRSETITSVSGRGFFIQNAYNFAGRATGGITKFSGQADIRFYGFNYQRHAAGGEARWGFGYNENGEGQWPGGTTSPAAGSNDVFSGIGLSSGGGLSYSAGDRISCCQDTTGVNRSARVEIYVR